MGIYRFSTTQIVAAGLDEVWQFIATPANLKHITPPHMGFDIQTPDLPDKMYQGMIIAYKVSPLPLFRTTWVTEITHVEEGRYFVDEQRMGPYSLWHHQHFIEAHEKGVLMTDIVHYRPPLGWFGDMANSIIIRPKLNEIFAFRRMRLDQHFGSDNKKSATVENA